MLQRIARESEPLARYLTQSSYYSANAQIVKPKAFEPPTNLRLSIFRVDGLTIDEIWENGQKNVIDKMPIPANLWGYAQIAASVVTDVNLSIVSDEPPPRHACIIGWPEGAERKSERMLLAQLLAKKARLKLRE